MHVLPLWPFIRLEEMTAKNDNNNNIFLSKTLLLNKLKP